MNFLLNALKNTDITQTDYHKLIISLVLMCITGSVIAIVSFFVRRFIDKELNILYFKKYNLLDKLMVIVSSSLLAMLVVGLCVLGISSFAKIYAMSIDGYFEKLVVTYATILTITYGLIMPHHPKLRLFKMDEVNANAICSMLSQIVSISFLIVSIHFIIEHIATNNQIVVISEWISILVLSLFYFIEFTIRRKLIVSSFVIATSSEYSIASKLTSFISNKFVLIATAGTLGMIICDLGLARPRIHFYECLFDVYQFVIILYLLQFVLSVVINKFIHRVELLEQTETSRKKNLIWICDTTVMLTYFIVVCYILKYFGIDVVVYLFHSKVIGTIFIVLATIIVFRAFREFMKAYQDGSFKSFLPLISVMFNFILFSIAGLIILENLGVETAPILASFTIINAAVAWAAQDALKSFIQGVMLLIEKSLLIGDYVCINNIKGTVEKLSIRVATLRLIDGSVQIIPYNLINSVTNFSRGHNVLHEVFRICDPKDIPNVIELMKEISQKILEQEQYHGNFYEDIRIEGVAPYNGKGIEIKWALTMVNGIIAVKFKDEFYMEMSRVVRNRNIPIPIGELYEEIKLQ